MTRGGILGLWNFDQSVIIVLITLQNQRAPSQMTVNFDHPQRKPSKRPSSHGEGSRREECIYTNTHTCFSHFFFDKEYHVGHPILRERERE
jgi:hypothetical protein